MSGSKPGPDRTTVHRYSQSFTDPVLLRRVKELQAEWGTSMAKTVERILAEALNHTPPPARQLPLDHDAPRDETAAA